VPETANENGEPRAYRKNLIAASGSTLIVIAARSTNPIFGAEQGGHMVVSKPVPA
jgi:hypothetical protein